MPDVKNLGLEGDSKYLLTPEELKYVLDNLSLEDESKLGSDLGFNALKFSNSFKTLVNIGKATGNSALLGIGSIGGLISDNMYNGTPLNDLKGRERTASYMNLLGGLADISRAFFVHNDSVENSDTYNTVGLVSDAVSTSLMGFSPIGTIIGGAMKVGKFALDSINTAGAKRTLNFTQNQNLISDIGSSYGGSVNAINKAANMANKKYGLFNNGGRHKADHYINKARNLQNAMQKINIDQESREALESNSTNDLRYQTLINGGFDPRYSLIAKQGLKLNLHINIDTKKVETIEESPEWEPVITTLPKELNSLKQGGTILEWEPVILKLPLDNEETVSEWKPIIEFKTGGSVKASEKPKQKNVIPEGNLHARLHHMENDENITKKGIPVIDNNGELLAEIELNEIIFTLEVTNKLEKLYNNYYNPDTSNKEKDQMAIDAGKLLVLEILFNTDDKTGLINTLKEGGKIDESKGGISNI